MTRTPLLIVALALIVAGCVTPPEDDGASGGNGGAGDTPAASLPEPIQDSQTVPASATVPNTPVGGVGVCELPSEQCFRYPFVLNATANITADLTWTVPANDFDLYVFQDGAPTDALSGAAPPGTSEHIEAELPAGSYELVVAAYATAGDTFTVSATFS